VYDGLNPGRVIFSGNSLSNKKLYLLYDTDSGHYNVITNLKAAMAKKYICNACDTLYDKKHKCDKACSLCTATPPCTKDQSKYCGTCNRWFLSEKCFQNHLTLKVKSKLVCKWRQVCRNCSFTVTTDSKHECFKRFCNYCIKKQPSGHFCYVSPMKPCKLTDRFRMSSLIRSAHRNLKSMMGPLSIFRTSYVLSRFVQSVKRWMI